MFELRLARSFPLSYVSEETAQELQDAGFTAMELSIARLDIHYDFAQLRREIETAVERVSRRGVRVLSVHLPFGRDWEISSTDDEIRTRALSRYLELIGAVNFVGHERYVLYPAFPGVPEEEREQRIRNACDCIARMAKAAHPIRIAVENMPQDVLANSAKEHVRIIETLRGMGADNVCACCDMNHWQFEKTEDAILTLGQYIETTHVSDYDGVIEKHWMPGKGANDWNRIIGALEEIGYTGPFLYECAHTHPSGEVAANYRMLFDAYNAQ